MARLLYFRSHKKHPDPAAVAYARRLIARIETRRRLLNGYMPRLIDGTCAICLGSGRLVRHDNLWKRCPCSN